MGAPQLNTYAYYDKSWNVDSTLPGPVSVSGKPGVTWVSLNWAPPQGGLSGNLAGYVVCRSLPNAKSAPQFIGDGGSNIVYVGTGTHFGDLPLSENTTELLNADSGLLPGTAYWYSVFSVTPPPAQSQNIFPKFTPGGISKPTSIQITTLAAPSYPNLVNDSDFSKALPTNKTCTSDWCFSPKLSSSNISSSTAIDPNDPILHPGNSKTSLFTNYMTINNVASSCSGVCSEGGANATCERGYCLSGNVCGTSPDSNCSTTAFPQGAVAPLCGCNGSATSSQIIYQTYTPDAGLVPGKLYSFSIWYRTNNPIPASLAINGNNQVYTPKFTVYGNNAPSEQSDSKGVTLLGAFQSEQYLENESSAGSYNGSTADKSIPCSASDSTSCKRTADYSMSANYQYYSNFTGIWQQAAFTFTIGSEEPSAIVNAYNGGDHVQIFNSNPNNKPGPTSFTSITISIEIPALPAGSQTGLMDFANAEMYEGLLPYTDPYWYIANGLSPTKNLIFNPNFWGVETETQGSVSPGWTFPPALNIVSDADACGPPCSGSVTVCKDKSGTIIQDATCTNTCTGTCDVTGACSLPGGSCSGNCILKGGTCSIDTTSGGCTGGFGTCNGSCSQTKAACTGKAPHGSSTATGSCGGTCTGICTYVEPPCQNTLTDKSCNGTCHDGGDKTGTKGGGCACNHKDDKNSASCIFPDGSVCSDSYDTCCNSNHLLPCPNSDNPSQGNWCKTSPPQPVCSNGSGTCTGSCNGTCESVCSATGTCNQTPNPNTSPTNCTGSAQTNGGICSAGSGTCSGAAVCFDTTNTLYTNITNSSICGSNQTGVSTFLAIQGCSCQGVLVLQANLKGYMGWFMGSFGLAPNKTYTLSFDLMIISNTNPIDPVTKVESINTLDIYINDMLGNQITKMLIPVPDAVTTGVFKPVSSYLTAPTTSITFTPTSPINIDLQFQIAKKNLSVGIKNVLITPVEGETYGIQNPYPAIMTKPFTTNANKGKDAILWRLPSTASGDSCPQCVLFGSTANSKDLSEELGWPQGLVLFNGFSHTGSFLENFNIVQETIATQTTYLQKLHNDNNTNVMQITVENFDTNKTNSNSSAFVMSNGYYGSGQWDIWVRLSGVYAAGSTTPIMDRKTPAWPANPIGCTFAFWVFHGLDYGVVGGPKILNEPSPFRNTEIDIEMNGSCPDYSFNFTNSTGRLNGWGGQAGGDGSNFTMHTYMPNDTSGKPINLNDGNYHKLSILSYSGQDATPDKIAPNAISDQKDSAGNPILPNYPAVRMPGFIKWFVDDIEWGCGWTGNTYGQDNVPMTAMRMVVGPWNPGWAGCNVCCITPNTLPNNGVCPCPSTAVAMDKGDIPITDCVTWDTATFNIAQIQFTPICTDCNLPGSTTYCPAVSLPARPTPSDLSPNAASNAPNIITAATGGSCGSNNVGSPNRDRTLPESKSFMVLAPSGCDANGNCCNGSSCVPDSTDCPNAAAKGNYCKFS